MKTFVCISSYYKGYDFMDECKKLGNKVILITSESLKEKNWPWQAIDEVYYMPEIEPFIWNLDHLIQGIQFLLKGNKIEAVVALDDFDVEKAALLRETFRIPGMGQTTHRYFRDKLAMRQMAKDSNIAIPAFTSVFNDEILHQFTQDYLAPWVLKPRSEASATGIKKVHSVEQLWTVINDLGEERYKFLLEVFKPGDVFHVDALVYQKKIVFTSCAQYLNTPMEVSHEGGVFRTKTLDKKSKDFEQLVDINTQVLEKFGLINGATHTEFIKSNEDGKFYFLETSSRVGGAHIPDMVEAATGINIWREWARLETQLLNHQNYQLPKITENYAGLIISLAKELHPNLDDFKTDELVKILPIDYHVGLIYQSKNARRIDELMESATAIIVEKHLSIMPPKNKSTN